MLWSCKYLSKFWSLIFRLLLNITGILLPLLPGLAILNIDVEDIPPPLRHVVIHILLAARLSIVRYWKSNLSPNSSETIRRTQTFYTYEIMLASSVEKYSQALTLLQPWVTWDKANHMI